MPNLNKEEKNGGKIELKPVSINEEYSMGVPAHMTKATSLNDDASLQFQNIFKEAYVIVIDEDKTEYINMYKEASVYDTSRSVLSNYTDTQVQSTTANMEVISQKSIKTLKINGLKAATTEIDATVEGVKFPITYFLTFIEGKEKLYFIMAWTLQDKKETHRAAFDQMARSFRMLKSKPGNSKVVSD
jgi:predicted Zn-dependent protease